MSSLVDRHVSFNNVIFFFAALLGSSEVGETYEGGADSYPTL